jgi:phosphoribosylanthranilate isomerase
VADNTNVVAYKGNTPFILSGGIAPNDVERIKNFSHPQFVGIDLNSNFEIEPAVKDVEKLKDFITKIR